MWVRDFRSLKVWQRALELTLDIYRVTGSFPRSEFYGLTSQMRRAAASIPTNIAEGAGRSGRTDYARFLSFSLASANELECQLLLAKDLQILETFDDERLTEADIEVRKMLLALRSRVKPAGTSRDS